MTLAIEPMDRIMPFAGINNFRDYGGYAARGGRLRRRLLYRSAQHKDATPHDLTKVGEIELAAVIDLRGDKERRHAPCPRPDGFGARIVFASDEAPGLAPHIEAARDIDGPESARVSMRIGYAEMVYRPYLVRVMTGYFAALAEADGPTLIHCMAGKDRTGIAVALFHRAMGVHRDDMIADYLMTNVAGNIEGRLAAGAVTVRKAFGAHLDDASVRALMTVEPSYLESAFAAIEEKNGGTDGYLRDVLGVTPALLERIGERLVA